MFTIDMLPAVEGDCLWIEYGDEVAPSRVLIDGGRVSAVDYIRARIRHVASTARDGVCRIELLVMTHVDADHIEGVIKLLGDASLPVEFGDIWFNGYGHLPGDDDDERDFLGGRQGEFLSALLKRRGLPWNEWFEGKSVFVPSDEDEALPRWHRDDGLELVVLSPTFERLRVLRKRWDQELAKEGLQDITSETAFALLMEDRKLAPDSDDLGPVPDPTDFSTLLAVRQGRDPSAANGSSIALLVRYEGASVLCTGDAYQEVLCESIRRLLNEEGVDRLELSAFKLPHHGSRNNVSLEMLELVDCATFLISTNGDRFHHPDAHTIAHLVAGSWRGERKRRVNLCFNYISDDNKHWNRQGLKDQWNFECFFPDVGGPPGLGLPLQATRVKRKTGKKTSAGKKSNAGEKKTNPVKKTKKAKKAKKAKAMKAKAMKAKAMKAKAMKAKAKKAKAKKAKKTRPR